MKFNVLLLKTLRKKRWKKVQGNLYALSSVLDHR
jgi:hypothetical protein